MNEPGIRHWIFGVIMLYGAVLVVVEMYRNWWCTDWERLFYDLFQYRSEFEEKMYKYDSEVMLEHISDEYVRQLIQSIGNKRHGKPKIQNISLTDYLLQHGIGCK